MIKQRLTPQEIVQSIQRVCPGADLTEAHIRKDIARGLPIADTGKVLLTDYLFFLLYHGQWADVGMNGRWLMCVLATLDCRFIDQLQRIAGEAIEAQGGTEAP